MEALHKINILVHVTTGTAALLLGVIALFSAKGKKVHHRSGVWFLFFLVFVVVTGLVGVFVFERNTFLLVITVLSGYVGFSGFRILKSKNNKAKNLDILISSIPLVVLVYFIYYFKSIGMIWSPVIIYSTVGALVMVIIYDFCRYLIPQDLYRKNNLWLYEHIYKMTSAFAALLSAFSGTVLSNYQPYSQFVPSILGLMIIFGFMIYTANYGLNRWYH